MDLVDALAIPESSVGEKLRTRIKIKGVVQGVGFRPFIYRLAHQLGLTGWVLNSPQGVVIEAEGEPASLQIFLSRIRSDLPPHASIRSLQHTYLEPSGFNGFKVRPSKPGGKKSAHILPDMATCPECLRELFDPADRRYRYPFINCTHCGPRYSIIESLPYDRAHTTMKHFVLCPACRDEYEDPANRRFHAQPNACPECGPHLQLWDEKGNCLSQKNDALLQAARDLLSGKIVALKGIGGFQLLVDARNEKAVNRLRERKGRQEKPFALMLPSLEAAKEIFAVSKLEAELLRSPQSPITLLKMRAAAKNMLAHGIAPGNPCLGLMLPYSPLHHLLMRELGIPIVATSGNRSEEPICTDQREALKRLGGIADSFLVHDRPIARHIDDSVAKVLLGHTQILRRARGYAPLPIHVKVKMPPAVAVGGHLKNTVAASSGEDVFLSQHLGDLDNRETFSAFRMALADLQKMYEFQPDRVVRDCHPDYLSSQHAEQWGLPVISVQHHIAHVFACMAEHNLDGNVLGVSWDGTGYGLDGTVWGGEFFKVSPNAIERAAHLRTFPLPGGESAVREPRRAALGLLFETTNHFADSDSGLPPFKAFNSAEIKVLETALKKKINSPMTSSAGRLFDAVASITGIRQVTNFEGQAAMGLEFASEGERSGDCYQFKLSPKKDPQSQPQMILDWRPMIHDILDDLEKETPVGLISRKFHNTLIEMIVVTAAKLGVKDIVLTGGCFQNQMLAEGVVRRLREEGFRPYWHQRIPPNDGGISVGQIVAAAKNMTVV